MKSVDIATDVVIPPDAAIAQGVVIQSHTLLAARMEIGANVTIERGVIFAEGGAHPIRLAAQVRIGAGSVIGPTVEIGWGAQILPGSVVLTSVPANAVVSGNPAQIVGYTQAVTGDGASGLTIDPAANRQSSGPRDLMVGGAAIYQMPKFNDLRGSLTVGELGKGFPFAPQRYFIVFDVPSQELRGEHAHKSCEQFLICVRGSCRALLDDGTRRNEVVLDRPEIGLYMPAMVWGTQYRYTRDAVLFVFASQGYDASDYIRTYDEFRTEVARRTP